VPNFLNSAYAPCQQWGMTQTHPDQWPTIATRHWWTNPLLLVSCLVFTAILAVGAWSHAGLLPEFLLTLTATMMLVAELLRRGWRWNEAVIQWVKLLISVAALLVGGWGWSVLVLSAIILGAWGVWLIIRARRRMRGDSAAQP
jgi:hypothetical protein